MSCDTTHRVGLQRYLDVENYLVTPLVRYHGSPFNCSASAGRTAAVTQERTTRRPHSCSELAAAITRANYCNRPTRIRKICLSSTIYDKWQLSGGVLAKRHASEINQGLVLSAQTLTAQMLLSATIRTWSWPVRLACFPSPAAPSYTAARTTRPVGRQRCGSINDRKITHRQKCCFYAPKQCRFITNHSVNYIHYSNHIFSNWYWNYRYKICIMSSNGV